MEKDLDSIMYNLTTALPLLFKSFKKYEHKCDFHEELPKFRFDILFILKGHGEIPTSEIAKHLFISKPQMTKEIDKLIEMGLVERLPDKKDRRVINIDLTEKGNVFLSKFMEKRRAALEERLSVLPEEDLIVLSESLNNIIKVLSKFA